MKRAPIGFLALASILSANIAAIPAQAQDSAASLSLDPHANETKAQRDARMKWWREARFGMFIHWGLYAVPAGVWRGQDTHGDFSAGAGEWIMHDLKIPVAPYAAQVSQFDPEQFDADTWVSIARAAGMKYIVMTAKHHEGFAMYPTKVDGFNIYDATRFKRDPIGEMAAACKKAGIKFGVYYSQNLDWHHPGGATAGPAWDDAQKGDYDAYIKNVSAPQVRELLTKYHPAVLWWDIPGENVPADDIRALTAAFPEDPGLIANNRLGNGVPGDTQTPEQYIPANGYPGLDWETCMTINNTWGYKSTDTDFKSGETLLRNLIDIASKGGNYLLNVGPTADGIIPQPEVQRLKEIGAWMKINGESIYGTTAGPYKRLPFDGRLTRKGDTLYLNVFHWPDSDITLPGVRTPVKEAYVLATKQKLTAIPNPDGSLTISRPDTLDSVSTAIAVKFASAPVIVEPEFVVRPQADGSIALRAGDAILSGSSIQVEDRDTPNIGFWTNSRDTAAWKVTVPSDGKYAAKLEYACQPGSEGSAFDLQVDGAKAASGTIDKTGGWQDYTTETLDGTVTLSAGTHVLKVVPTTMPQGAVMNLRSITLTSVS
jgi:alpha-L-fucosidase